tara:strand:- start:81928 stop:83181 length:1254 start_codon:yes stop_codon:yes gene_type:complete
MKTTNTYNVLFALLIVVVNYSLQAQNSATKVSDLTSVNETQKRQENYKVLKDLGYTEIAIFEDLGNANFLNKNYETALYWYTKLFKLSDGNNISKNYYERYQFALKATTNPNSNLASSQKDWVAQIKEDYKIPSKQRQTKFNDFNFGSDQKVKALEAFVAKESVQQESTAGNKLTKNLQNQSPIAMTVDGNTAYYTKQVAVKPLYGVFSKKELVHKIFKANYSNGTWTSTGEVALGPKNASVMHPTISEDGSRLFFASDMPGTFGKFDIYVATIQKNGVVGVAKNLGQKVNTNEDDLYPNIMGGTSLFFASNGHQGYGGLDVYMVEVAHNKVGATVNLGSPINSMEDDFSIQLITDKDTGYVVLQRGENYGNTQRVAYAYDDPSLRAKQKRKEYHILEALNTESKINYSSSIFEDNE